VGELTLDIGQVTALVQGSRAKPYSVVVRVRTFNDDEWKRVMDVLGGEIGHTAALLDGELPVDIAQGVAPEEMFLDKAQLLALSAPEWVALVGGLRAMGANYDGSAHGIFTERVGALTNDFFTVLTSMDYEWRKDDEAGMTFTLADRATGEARFKAMRSDLIFGSNSQLRAVAEVYASRDGHARFVKDFVKVWNKIMMLDRFDVRT
jgi:catalase (peroxidase I)